MHLKRLIVAVLILPALYLYVMYLPLGFFFVLLIAVSLIALSEFYSMYRVRGMSRYASLFLGTVILGVSYFSKSLLPDLLLVAAMSIMVIRLLSKRDPVSSLADIAVPVVGILYIPGLFSFQTHLRHLGPEWILFLYGTVWASDSMAYYIGKGFGKRKLYVEMSPNKTVAGATGSVIGGATGALLLQTVIVPQLTAPSAVFAGIMIGIVTIVGDLVESMFKRDAGVKDSGGIIPGHGGVLDKVDGALFAGPVLYWILTGILQISRIRSG
jgi:phosphatidate cytidylyltransferase